MTRSPNDSANSPINDDILQRLNGPVHTSSPKALKFKSRSPEGATPKRRDIIAKEAIIYSNGALAKELTRAGRYGPLGGLSDVNEGSALFTEAENLGAVRRQS